MCALLVLYISMVYVGILDVYGRTKAKICNDATEFVWELHEMKTGIEFQRRRRNFSGHQKKSQRKRFLFSGKTTPRRRTVTWPRCRCQGYKFSLNQFFIHIVNFANQNTCHLRYARNYYFSFRYQPVKVHTQFSKWPLNYLMYLKYLGVESKLFR
jgi:hypothetical protein